MMVVHPVPVSTLNQNPSSMYLPALPIIVALYLTHPAVTKVTRCYNERHDSRKYKHIPATRYITEDLFRP